MVRLLVSLSRKIVISEKFQNTIVNYLFRIETPRVIANEMQIVNNLSSLIKQSAHQAKNLLN